MKFYNIDIEKLAFDAILGRGSVTLDGLATLRARTIPSKVDKNGLITPPRKIVEVCRVNTSDSQTTLPILMADFYDVSHEIALKGYEKWAESVQTNLDSGDRVFRIDGVGVIKFSKLNSMIFRADRKLLFSLNPLTPIVGKILSSKESVKVAENKESDNIEEKSSKPWSKIALLISFVMLLSSLSYVFLSLRKSKPSRIEKVAQVEEIVRDTTTQEHKTTIIAKKDSVDVEIDDKNLNFHLVVGVFAQEDNADKQVDVYRKQGFKPRKVEFDGRAHFYVILDSFESENRAREFIKGLDIDPKVKHDFWIYEPNIIKQ